MFDINGTVIEIGSCVRVLHGLPINEEIIGWGDVWVQEMNDSIRNLGEVIKIEEIANRIQLRIIGNFSKRVYYYPPFVLEVEIEEEEDLIIDKSKIYI